MSSICDRSTTMRLARVLTILVLTALLAPAAAAQAQDTAVDVAIAIDTTGSMTPSIEQAKLDAHKIVADTQQQLPNAQFAIIQFRDKGDNPEYRVEQSMTGDADRISAAVGRLSAAGGGDSPESYNLLFHRATVDSDIGYRNGATKLLFVIGDAEPHGAGSQGLDGCSDRSQDPHSLNTLDVLKELRDAQITLNMILQRSSAQTTLKCYQSLVNKAYGNGTAKASGPATGGCSPSPGPTPGPGPDPAPGPTPMTASPRYICPGGPPCDPTPGTVCPMAAPTSASSDYAPGALAKAVGDSISASLPGLTLTTDKTVHSGRRLVATLRVRNRTAKSVFLRNVRLLLPGGFSTVRGNKHGTVTFKTAVKMKPGAARTLRVIVTAAPPSKGKYVLHARALFKMPDGGAYTAKAARSSTVD